VSGEDWIGLRIFWRLQTVEGRRGKWGKRYASAFAVCFFFVLFGCW